VDKAVSAKKDINAGFDAFCKYFAQILNQLIQETLLITFKRKNTFK